MFFKSTNGRTPWARTSQSECGVTGKFKSRRPAARATPSPGRSVVDVFGVGEPQPVRPLTVSCESLSRLCRYERRPQHGPSGNGWPGRALWVAGEEAPGTRPAWLWPPSLTKPSGRRSLSKGLFRGASTWAVGRRGSANLIQSLCASRPREFEAGASLRPLLCRLVTRYIFPGRGAGEGWKWRWRLEELSLNM